jgi:hypothetical protein
VVYLEKYGEQIWGKVAADPVLPEQQRRQIEALRILMALAERAGLAFAVSRANHSGPWDGGSHAGDAL